MAHTPDESQMQTPPPVSGQAYPTTVGSQVRFNYLAAGLTFNTAYNDNVLTGDSTVPVSDLIYSILPTVTLDQATARQHLTLVYSPGFTFYQHTSALNAADQSVALNLQYRPSEHTSITLGDIFQKSTNVFDQLYPLSGGAISGSTQSLPTEVVAPYANRLSNVTNMGFSDQFARNRMIGVGGIVTENNYPNPTEASGLYNSNSLGGSIFYNQRLSSTQYTGVTYQYLRSQSNPASAQANPVTAQAEVQTHTILGFYTIYLNPTLSFSLSGGPQYFEAAQSPLPAFHSWTPSVMASIGWQRSHTNFAASYSRTVTGNLGLSGAFDANSANASVRWQIVSTWIVGSAGGYSNSKNVTPSLPSSNPGGQTISGTASVQHSISEYLEVELGYAHLHQNYSGIAVISAAPDSNREFISITYHLTRPLGR
jgi:hypothetical protein